MAFFPKSDSKKILDEIEKELEEIIYGSIEIYVHDREVTQISVRKIQKTNIKVKGNRQMPHPPQSKKHESSIKTDSKMGLDK